MHFTDINECKTNNANCAQQCVNTNGSYYCKCQLGYSRNPDNITCESIHVLHKHTKLPFLLQGVMRLTQTNKLSSYFLLVFQVSILHFIIVYGR